MKSQFLLDPNITYLNHGAFGACPKPIFEDYQQWQQKLEFEPTQFITKKAAIYLNESKEALANFIGCDAHDFFFVQNPTYAINLIMRSLSLKAGDEILATNHEYGAMDRTWHFYEKKTGVKYIRQNISLPIVSKEQILTEFWQGYTPQTKVVFLNHYSSATALIFPVKEICDKARELGLIVIVDGAHVPGHIDLDIATLNPDFYTGTVHKWLCTPKGSSFLYVKKEYQKMLEPLVVSWGYEPEFSPQNQFLEYHQIQGTRDIAAYLTLPKAIAFRTQNNWDKKTSICKKIILEQYEDFCNLLGTKPICPVSPEFLGQMCSIPVKTKNAIELKTLLYEKYKIEIPIMTLNGGVYMRISFQVYNNLSDLEQLKAAIIDIQKTTDLID
jgi:isopenicillin-N epimerase